MTLSFYGDKRGREAQRGRRAPKSNIGNVVEMYGDFHGEAFA